MIKFNSKFSPDARNLAFFVSENLEISGNKDLPSDLVSKMNSFLSKNKKNNKKNILTFDLTANEKCFFIIIKKKLETYEINNLGAELKLKIKSEKNIENLNLFSGSFSENIIVEFAYGFELKSYSFEKYKSKKNDNIQNIEITVKNLSTLNKKYNYLSAVKEGVYLTRNLVSEPPNVLYPKKYVDEIKKLSKFGLKIEVLDEKKLKKLGMNSLLGVGQGSEKDSFVVIIKWNGSKSKSKPLAFVGKGVCFDTGGISLKPARYMEEMKYDMGGSAVVVGLMKSLALRKAKINAVGVVGLVENMPDGNAQRPGDIVKSYSGKTIEVLNTDAEGRLVLADVLTYTEKKYNPKFIIDLATLTGAIIIALGEEYAGLFSNNDLISKQLYDLGNKINEKVWKLPLHKNYDKLMNSSYADVQNINYAGGAGSITAAQFLQRFIVNNTPWAHLDIAGMAFSKKAANLNSGGATGFGVRLLNDLILNHYE